MRPHAPLHPHSLFDFGPVAHEYERWYGTPAGRMHDRIQKQDVRTLLRPARGHERLLDVGCGTGHWSAFFLSLGYEVRGVDLSGEMIAAARTAVPGCTFDVADACDLPFEDASFDVVACMATLEFLSDPAAGVREMARCVKPGGSLLIGTLNRLAPLNRHRLSKGRQPYASGRLQSPGELRALLRRFGRARMVASRVPSSDRDRRLGRPIDHQAARGRRKLTGPFLVAEVRL